MEEAAAQQFLCREAKGLTGAKLSPVNPEAGQAEQYRAGQRRLGDIPKGTLQTPVSCLASHSTEEKGLCDMTAEAGRDRHSVAADEQMDRWADRRMAVICFVRSFPGAHLG